MVARQLQAGYPIAGLKTLAELADRAGVSAPSVIRCVRKLGFSSYPAFQHALHEEVQEIFDEGVGPRKERRPAVDEELEAAYSDSITETIRRVRQSEIDRLAVELARGSANILCLGGRISQALAMVFQAQLLRLRKNVELVSSNPVERAERLMDVGKGDVVVVFDFAPYDSQTVSFARLAAANTAIVVCFTDAGSSPAAAHANYVIPAATAIGDSHSLSAAVCASEIVLRSVLEKIGSRASTRRESLAGAPLLPLQPDSRKA